ncbi:hypothetical protein AB0O07_31930 [Streptomyces sp. NPDC093085]|uniref:hypothetical protein n=1 Tax=Streptomyces sp. NPDC093085 TaxID=3155068 RepID=UPI00344374BB
MHETHKEAVEAERYADRAEQYAADPTMPSGALVYCARKAVDHAVRAQKAAGVEATAADLRPELERRLTVAEYAERESACRRWEAEQEAQERAATGMDSENRDRVVRNRHLADEFVADLCWTAGHVRVLEAAESGRLYWRDGRARQAARHGVWNGGRRISRERTQALFAARFLVAVRQEDGARVLALSPMGHVALELVRLNPAALYGTDQAAYEARFAKVRRRHKRRDDQKAAAHRLPALNSTARNLYRRPVTLVQQHERAEREAVERWEEEGGHCPGADVPALTAGSGETVPAGGIRFARRYSAEQPALW